MIKTVIRCENDMVVVFDKRGRQLPRYQGQYTDVKGKILMDSPADTIFLQGCDVHGNLTRVDKENW